MEDYINIDEVYRLRLIKRTALSEATHVAVSQTVRSEDGDVGVTDARFALERSHDGAWIELKEEDLNQAVYLDVRPKILRVVEETGCLGERLDVEVHVPVLASRRLARRLAELRDKPQF